MGLVVVLVQATATQPSLFEFGGMSNTPQPT
jgi:hypothetical protein